MVPKPLFNKGQKELHIYHFPIKHIRYATRGSTDARQNYLTATRTYGERGRACGPLSNNGRIGPNRYSNTDLTTHTLLCDDNRLASAVLVDNDFPCYFYPLTVSDLQNVIYYLTPVLVPYSILFFLFVCRGQYRRHYYSIFHGQGSIF